MLVELIADSESFFDKGNVETDARPSGSDVLSKSGDDKGLIGLDKLEEHSRYIGMSNKYKP